jgi:predicted Zn-dependent peptidase
MSCADAGRPANLASTAPRPPARARRPARSVLMNLETRGLLVEDVGRQILSHGKRLDPSALVARIRAVTPEDIIRVMRTALAAPPSFAAVGDVSRIADYEAIREHRE